MTERVLITGAAGQIAAHLVPLICQGLVCGTSTMIDLVLFDLPSQKNALLGLQMEIDDCAYPLLRSITITSDYSQAFTNTSLALLVGGKPRGPGMERKDLILDNAHIFVDLGHAIRKFAPEYIRVIVVANPANTNCWILYNTVNQISKNKTNDAENVDNISNKKKFPSQNFTALTRLDHDRALSQYSQRAHIPIDHLSNMIIWGNHSSLLVPDLTYVNTTSNQQSIPDNINTHIHTPITSTPTNKISLNYSNNTTPKQSPSPLISSLMETPQTLQSSEQFWPKTSTRFIPSQPTEITGDWIDSQFTSQVQQRGAAVIAARKKSSAMSAANAIANHAYQWLHGATRYNFERNEKNNKKQGKNDSNDQNEKNDQNTEHGFNGSQNNIDWCSMAVISNGEYGIEKGLVFSYPCELIPLSTTSISFQKNNNISTSTMTSSTSSSAQNNSSPSLLSSPINYINQINHANATNDINQSNHTTHDINQSGNFSPHWRYEWKVVENLAIHQNVGKRIAESMFELQREKDLIKHLVE